jgi:hypothetical protein
MKTTRTLLIIIFMIVLIIISVSADSNNTTGSTAVPTGNITTVPIKPTSTLQTTSILTPLNTTPALVPANTTVVPTTASDSALDTSANTTTTQIPAEPSDDQPRTGNITAVSSPLGANILIDGVFYGYTPGIIAGISTGNHIVRLSMSGYYDYEGNIYILPGQVTSVYGTLQPINNYPPAQDATTVPTTAAVQSTPVTPVGPLENPTVLAAIIGTFSAVIGAIVAILTHFSKLKKE